MSLFKLYDPEHFEQLKMMGSDYFLQKPIEFLRVIAPSDMYIENQKEWLEVRKGENILIGESENEILVLSNDELKRDYIFLRESK
jgi:hypothetical protein